MSTPSGVLRAELYLRVLPHRGMPPRGSFQDRVAQEMLLRERRERIAESMYLGQLLRIGFFIPEASYSLWTQQYVDQVSHATYRPNTVTRNRQMLGFFEKRRKSDARAFKSAQSYEITTATQLRPYTPAQIEELKSKMRKRALQNASKGVKP